MTDEAFKVAFTRAQEHFKLTDEQVSDILHVGKRTLALWKQGKNLPFHMLRSNLIRALIMHAPEANRPTSELDALKRKMLSTKTSSCASLLWEFGKAPEYLQALAVEKRGNVGDVDFLAVVPPGEVLPDFACYDIESFDIGDAFRLVLA